MSIRIGLIGAGNISNTHARAAREIPGVELAAIYGTNKEKVHRLCQEFGAKPYTDFKSFLAHPMDAVIIGSPSGVHAEQGIAAAQRRLHVLTEKPIDISTERADALISACKQAGVKLAVIFQDRFKPDIRRLKEFLHAGGLGKILLVDARVKWYRPPEYYRDSKWRGTLALDGGGALMNQGIHTVDLLIWLFGDVVSVKARTGNILHKIESEDTALAVLEFLSGAKGTLLATTAAYPGYPRRLEITGTEGTIVLEQDRIIAADLRNQNESLVSADPGDQNPSASSPVVSDVRGHRNAIEDFISAIETNGTPLCDGIEGRRSLALVEAIYESAGFVRKKMQRAM
ncbi:MAG TPA: Gfo/Idh/MocA family oxidoreductase [Terriglobales bacterium]